MPQNDTYHGIYLPESDGEPIALFKFADQAQQIRKTFYGNTGAVAPVEVHVPRHDEIADLLAAPADAAASSTAGEDALRAQIRAELVAERTRERIRRELEAELAAEEEAGPVSDDGDTTAEQVADPERDAGGSAPDPDATVSTEPKLVELTEPLTPGTETSLTEPKHEEVYPSVSVAQRDALAAAGFETAEQIRNASDAELLAVDGVGPGTVTKLREATRE